MLKLPWSSTTLSSSSCNIAASSNINNPKALIKKQCRLFGAAAAASSSLRLTISTRRRNDAVSCEAAEYNSASSEKSVADRLWPGSLTEDGLSYKEKFIVRCYEVGINKTATVDSIANLLQKNRAKALSGDLIRRRDAVSLRRPPSSVTVDKLHSSGNSEITEMSDVVEIESWFESKGGIGIRRDWILKDYATHEQFLVLFCLQLAKCGFVLINWCISCTLFVMEPRLAFPEEKNGSLKKIAKLEDAAQYSRQGLVVRSLYFSWLWLSASSPTHILWNLQPRRAADLDMNQHVNNVAYIRWVLETLSNTLHFLYTRQSMPQEIIDTHELETITIDYKKECKEDDVVDSHTSPEPYNGTAAKGKEDYCQFLHLLTLSGDGLEIGRCYTEWRKKPTRQAYHSV
ncbi:hypothetical protein C3L33_04339, partial [Rhododendron williamsianum]